MPRVFISYRRKDSEVIVGRIYDHLVRTFGAGNVFKDVDAITPGSDFRVALNDAVRRCDVLVAVIGGSWINSLDERGQHRLENPNDFVRLEIEAGLARKIPVIPVLVTGAIVPTKDELPPSLAELAYRNAIAVRTDPDFTGDIGRLVRAIRGRRRFSPRTWLIAAGVVAVIAALIAWVDNVMFLRSHPPEPPWMMEADNPESARSITLVATGPVQVSVTQRVDKLTLLTRKLKAGDREIIEKYGPVYLEFSVGQNLHIEAHGKYLNVPIEGEGAITFP